MRVAFGRSALLAVLLLGGCVAQDAREALDAATVAETRIGDSGSQALSGVASLTSRLDISCDRMSSSLAASTAHVNSLIDAASSFIEASRPTAGSVAGIASELHGITVTLHDSVDDGWVSKKMTVVVTIGVLVLVAHGAFEAWRTRRHASKLYGKVRGG